MGSAPDEACREPGFLFMHETRHPVMLTHHLAIASTEVTHEQFEVLMGYNPSHIQSVSPQCVPTNYKLPDKVKR